MRIGERSPRGRKGGEKANGSDRSPLLSIDRGKKGGKTSQGGGGEGGKEEGRKEGCRIDKPGPAISIILLFLPTIRFPARLKDGRRKRSWRGKKKKGGGGKPKAVSSSSISSSSFPTAARKENVVEGSPGRKKEEREHVTDFSLYSVHF